MIVTGAHCFARVRPAGRTSGDICGQIGLPVCRRYFSMSVSAPSRPPPESLSWPSGAAPPRQQPSALRSPMPTCCGPPPFPREVVGTGRILRIPGRKWSGSRQPVDTQVAQDYYFRFAVPQRLRRRLTPRFIDAGIIGRPVHEHSFCCRMARPRCAAALRYLFEAGGGLLNAAHSFYEHLAQLEAAVARPSSRIQSLCPPCAPPVCSPGDADLLGGGGKAGGHSRRGMAR